MLFELLLRGIRREIDANGRDAHLGAIPVLPTDIGMRTRIVTNEHRRQPGNDSAFAQRRNPNSEVLLDRGCGRFTVQNLSRSRPHLGRATTVDAISRTDTRMHTGRDT